jgi:RNA polymerase sigma-70 factor (sigma-E family)
LRGSERQTEFVDFVRAHRSDLVRTAVLLCAGDHAWAEDLVQTTLTKLYLAWSRVRRADRPLAYARTSLTNAFIDERRRAHRRRESTTAEMFTLDASVTDGDHALRQLVLDALGQLGPRQRAVVVLRHWHDLDVAETARILGCSEGTVKSQNARALAHLRTVLGSERLLVAGEA